uniref:Uncharacterized protein n=1 Tax=viral metagenome TaxID=1070528 RepID=A0A6C0IZI4_9ZZZZ
MSRRQKVQDPLDQPPRLEATMSHLTLGSSCSIRGVRLGLSMSSSLNSTRPV